jgi:hypothetical protein
MRVVRHLCPVSMVAYESLHLQFWSTDTCSCFCCRRAALVSILGVPLLALVPPAPAKDLKEAQAE